MRSLPIVMLSVLAAACAGTTGPADIDVELELDFRLLLGGTAVVEEAGLAIEFKAVPQDSRCPPYAYCVWAGDGAVELRVRDTGSAGEETRVTLHTNPSQGSASATFGVYLITMLSLEPSYRVAQHTDYVVTLRVVQLSVQSLDMVVQA